MKKSTKIFTSLLPLSSLLAPILVSCGNNEGSSKKETPGYQTGFLKQQSSKNQLILSVIDSYLEKFYANDLTNINEKDKILNAIENKENKLHKDLYDIFKYYATKLLEGNPQLFWNLKHELIKLNIDTANYNPAPENLPNEDEFIFLMKNSKFLSSNIRLELEKLLVSKLYLLKSREEYKTLTLNEHGLDKYQVSLEEEMKKDSTTKIKKDIYESLDLTSSNLYLVKYIIENPLIQKWSFTDEKDMNLRVGKANVSTFEDFNNLASYNPNKSQQYDYNPVAKNPEYLLKTGTSEGADVLKTLRAFSGIQANTEVSGDLSNTLYSIQKAKSPIFGFVDPSTKKVLDQDYFKFAKILKQEQKLPKLKASAELKNKQADEEKIKSLTAADIEFEGLTRDNSNQRLFTKTVTVDSNSYTMQFEVIDSITFSGQLLRAKINLSIKELGARHTYEFSTDLEYKDKQFVDQTDSNDYNLDKLPSFIDMIKNNKIEASYVVKIAPLHLENKTKNLKGEEITKRILTFENTPWKEEDQQNILANYIVVSKGTSLFREANKYILDNLGFKLSNLNDVVLELFKVEGLI